MPTPIPFADDGGTPARRATPPAPRIPIWRFLIALAALPPLLAFMAAASWLAWMCFEGVMGPPGAVIALAGMAALAALIRRHTGMEVGLALCLVAVVGLIGLVWVVFALLAVALVASGEAAPLVGLGVSVARSLDRIITGVAVRTVPPDVANLHEPPERLVHAGADRLAQFASADAGALAH